MLRADAGAAAGNEADRSAARQLISFARESGVYAISGKGHVNLFQLFLERALRLTRRGGRVGIVVPWGLASDQGCAALRRMLLETADTDSLVASRTWTVCFPYIGACGSSRSRRRRAPGPNVSVAGSG
jgi:hypothetical protein